MKKNFLLVMTILNFVVFFIVESYSEKYTYDIINQRVKSYSISKDKKNRFLKKNTFLEAVKKLFEPAESTFKPKNTPMMLSDVWEEYGVNAVPNYAVIQPEAVKDLNLLQGSSIPKNSFISHVTTNDFGKTNKHDYLTTIFGQKRFTEIIAMPEFDLAIIKARQEKIKVLFKKNVFRKDCFDILQKMKMYESYFFYYFDRYGLDNAAKAIYLPECMMIATNDSPHVITTVDIMSKGVMRFAGCVASGYFMKDSLPSWIKWSEESFFNRSNTPERDFFKGNSYNAMCAFVVFSYLVYEAVALKTYLEAVKSIQERVIGFAQQVKLSKELLEKARDNNIIFDGIDEQISFLAGRNVTKILRNKGLEEDLVRKVEWLQGQLWSRAYFSSGHILVANKYLCDPEVRKVYKEAFEMIGEVDCYVALAKKMAAHKDKANAPFCFVDFIENSQKPFIDIKNFWNPFISDDVVVPNDLTLNGANGVRGLVVTGPNTSGKSGNAKGFFLNLILAQSFGIAAASECSMTMFRRIITYLNIADDAGRGLSLFKAAVKCANKLVKTLSRLPKNEFGVCLMDEPYVGTEQAAAAKAATENILSINGLENCLFIVNTHMNELISLEKSYPSIANYRIGAVSNSETGRIEFTYKLEPGISEISSAAQVVADVDEDDDFDDEE